ncbi:MAG: C2H2-type zinc finger protein [Nitrososphaerales archaeon]
MQRSLQLTLSLTGGILILVGGIVSLAWLLMGFPPTFDILSELRETMGEREFELFQIRYTIAGLSTGIAVILTAYMLKVKPEESRRWGVMIVILSAMSILGMGGFIAGMVLGIAGGMIAIIRGGKMQVIEKGKDEKKVTVALPEEKNIIFKCSSCEVIFRSDEDLRNHVIKMHLRH